MTTVSTWWRNSTRKRTVPDKIPPLTPRKLQWRWVYGGFTVVCGLASYTKCPWASSACVYVHESVVGLFVCLHVCLFVYMLFVFICLQGIVTGVLGGAMGNFIGITRAVRQKFIPDTRCDLSLSLTHTHAPYSNPTISNLPHCLTF